MVEMRVTPDWEKLPKKINKAMQNSKVNHTDFYYKLRHTSENSLRSRRITSFRNSFYHKPPTYLVQF